MLIVFVIAISQKEWVALTGKAAILMTLTNRTIPTTITVTPTATPETISTDEAESMQHLSNLPSVPSTKSTFIQIYLSTRTRESFNHERETSVAGTVNVLDLAILISVIGAVLTVLLLVAAILYRCVCWNKYIGR